MTVPLEKAIQYGVFLESQFPKVRTLLFNANNYALEQHTIRVDREVSVINEYWAEKSSSSIKASESKSKTIDIAIKSNTTTRSIVNVGSYCSYGFFAVSGLLIGFAPHRFRSLSSFFLPNGRLQNYLDEKATSLTTRITELGDTKKELLENTSRSVSKNKVECAIEIKNAFENSPLMVVGKKKPKKNY